ncbi:hypothetical protein EDC04DRAFT_2600034 [Pisolithus marmoratus]|nr:hypothetical protein EDC04DRAFT_2600034 [Pisolithus marmoratus]
MTLSTTTLLPPDSMDESSEGGLKNADFLMDQVQTYSRGNRVSKPTEHSQAFRNEIATRNLQLQKQVGQARQAEQSWPSHTFNDGGDFAVPGSKPRLSIPLGNTLWVSSQMSSPSIHTLTMGEDVAADRDLWTDNSSAHSLCLQDNWSSFGTADDDQMPFPATSYPHLGSSNPQDRGMGEGEDAAYDHVAAADESANSVIMLPSSTMVWFPSALEYEN